eukprot:CAMPEP_0170495242 /NCGR_PEP_ID=MMETSP0208-20121228/15097_1 /TAXON_ID=197538 /ORGANISM="Strombidium inclinatum, Strain S3" /LENGTH=51 /DNA_ID=CAMNT_0010771401 /DNA_START=1111 /DNA_END=1266 /DNA_ORIENTATION=+
MHPDQLGLHLVTTNVRPNVDVFALELTNDNIDLLDLAVRDATEVEHSPLSV